MIIDGTIQYFADKRYGQVGSQAGEQGSLYNNNDISGLGSHLIALENFNPNLSSSIDPFHWIPKGLFYDLLDKRNETIATGGPVNDGVSGYTNQQFFNVLSSSITSVSAYKSNFILANSISPSTQVINLFAQYSY